MTSDGTHSYTYDAEGNLTAVDGGATAKYVYNALNQRVETTNAGGTYEFLYDNAGRRISRWLTSNSGNEGNIYWGNQLLAFRASDSHTYFEHPDWTGTTRVRTDYGGNVAGSMATLPFGDGTSLGINNANAEAETAHYAMQDKDFYGSSDSGTNHALFRQYMGTVGSWMSPDPYLGSYDASNPQSMNRYSYVENNPLSYVDPDGTTGCQPGAYCFTVYANGDFVYLTGYCSTGACYTQWETQGSSYFYGYPQGSGGQRNSSGKPAPKKPQKPKQPPCDPATRFAGVVKATEAAGDASIALNLAGIHFGGALFLVGAGCLDPTPFEPATCAAAGFGAADLTGSGAVLFYLTYREAKDEVVPAVKQAVTCTPQGH